MKIEDIRTLRGPNVFSHKPVLVATLNLGSLTEVGSHEIPNFTSRLLDLLPGLIEHHCSPGRFGGFVERLNRGTYFGHIVEHIALELSQLAGMGVNFGKTVYAGRPGLYRVAVGFRSEEGMKFILGTAVELARSAVAEPGGFPLAERLDEARQIRRRFELGPSTRAILDAADRCGVPWTRLDSQSLIQLGYGKHRRLIQATTTERTGNISVMIAQDKDLTKRLLRAANIRVPEGVLVTSESEALAAFKRIGAPAVLKPADGHHGEGVYLNLNSAAEVCEAFREVSRFSGSALLEEHLTGHDYRVLVVGGKMVAAAERIPAFVVGDGQRSVEQLVAMENENPLRGEGHEKPLTRIELDRASARTLQRQGLGLDSIPAAGVRVFLKETANVSTGGIAVDVTENVHPEIRLLCERAARVVGLDVCGVDLIASGVSGPLSREVALVEVNAGPGIRMHVYPSEGRARDAGGAILESLFPNGMSGRIPIVSVTGTNGKTTVTRLVSHMLTESGQVVGTTTSDGIFIGTHRVAWGDTTGPSSAWTILSDPGVDVAVLETARGGLVRRGLAFDWCDVGVITNVSADHIGQDGIESVDDILRIKSLILERVHEGGTLVLNAQDERLRAWVERNTEHLARRKLALFSLDPDHAMLKSHVLSGGVAYVFNSGWIEEWRQGRSRRWMHTSEIPLTLAGTARFQVANVLAAIACGVAQGVSETTICSALRNFQIHKHNRGRTNLYKVGKGYAMLDYAHNPGAFQAVCEMAAHWSQRRLIGVVGVPGDRSDEVIRQAAVSVARGFDEVIIRDDIDLRGRRAGEAPELLRRIIEKECPTTRCRVILDEVKAMRAALSGLGEEDLTIVFYDEYEIAERVLRDLGAHSVEDLDGLRPIRNGRRPLAETGT
ncbi:MAG: cyanophycin synthetase [Bdellovibrionales bacterium]